jgi:hypothetical protein
MYAHHFSALYSCGVLTRQDMVTGVSQGRVSMFWFEEYTTIDLGSSGRVEDLPTEV